MEGRDGTEVTMPSDRITLQRQRYRIVRVFTVIKYSYLTCPRELMLT